MDEREVSQEDVFKEHIESVNVGAHAAYMTGVILGSLVLMVLLIAALGATGG